MKHTPKSDFGRPGSSALSSQQSSAPHDKWALLSALTDAAAIYELNHRTLSVLKALLTFWPDRELNSDANGCIVFPSNRTLAERLNGMPESTLRRHLARLVSLGVVSRHNSPNNKRYARRCSGAAQQAFGFDLSPLARHSDHLMQQAQAERQARHALLNLRDRVAVLRQKILLQQGNTCLTEQARVTLRRKPVTEDLESLETALSEQVAKQTETTDSPQFSGTTSAEMSRTDDQNERHIQDSIKHYFDSERASEKSTEKRQIQEHQVKEENRTLAPKNIEKLTLAQVLSRCPEAQTFFPGPIQTWSDLIHLADRLAPMLGIDQPVFAQAKQYMGSTPAAISLLCILERSALIRSPGAYLRRLTQKAATGGFSVLPMLSALKDGGKQANCQLTT